MHTNPSPFCDRHAHLDEHEPCPFCDAPVDHQAVNAAFVLLLPVIMFAVLLGLLVL